MTHATAAMRTSTLLSQQQQRKNSKHRCATRTLLTSAPPLAKPAFAPVVSSNDERPAETSEMHDLQQQKHMLSIYVCAISSCSSCRWAPLFLAASRGQIGGYSDGRRRESSRLTPRDAPRHRGPRLRFATGSSHLFLARTWMRNGRPRLRTIGGIPLPSLTRSLGMAPQSRRRRRT